MTVQINNTPYTKEFLINFANDLRSIGANIDLAINEETITFSAYIQSDSSIKIKERMEKARLNQLRSEESFIRKVENNNVLNFFLEGSRIDIDAINPEIRICKTEQDFRLFRYCSFYQKVPSSNRIGRQIKALIFDTGQEKPVLMGIINLASSIYTLGSRDSYLNWDQKNKSIKDFGLKRIMDLAICMAIPPYNDLLAGKLISALALSDPIRQEFESKYKMPLLGISTTCATGLHCPIFNRFIIKEGGLFRRIGETAGYTTYHIREQTMRAARQLLLEKDFNLEYYSVSSETLRILRKACSVCKIPYKPFFRLGIKKGVYFATISENALNHLRKGEDSFVKEDFSTELLVDYWKYNLLNKRVKNGSVIKQLRLFKPESLLLSKFFDHPVVANN